MSQFDHDVGHTSLYMQLHESLRSGLERMFFLDPNTRIYGLQRRMTLIDVGSSHAAESEHSVDWAPRQILHAHRIDIMEWATKMTKSDTGRSSEIDAVR